MYKKVSTKLDFVKNEKEIMEFWKENDIFKRSIEERKDGETFTFYDGPPTANGKPHIGHILTRAIKDIIPRYKTMKGYKVLRKAGWDTHGLPVELEVEKLLGIDGKPEIEKYGVEPFIKKCKESVWKYEKEWREISERVGFWADMDNPYVTYYNDYIESVWWAIKTIWDKGLIYKGHKIIPYCPRCGTSLSSHEVAQGYKDVKESSIYVKFKLKNEENTYFLAWTTTPWTLPSNVALTVNPEKTYIRAKCGDEIYIMADALSESVLSDGCVKIDKMQGKELEGIEYEPLFDFAKIPEKAFYICLDDFVTLSDGTGIVHTAPAFGEDDAKVGRKYGLPFVQYVNDQGNFIKPVDKWEGMFVKDADKGIIDDLRERGLLLLEKEYEHSYPFCWRCDTPLIYYARDTWFIEMTKMKDRLLANNDKINWLPDNIKKGRFGNFLENVVDWSLSRERFWGTPLPIWECSCGHRLAIGSIEELKSMSDNTPDDIELHKPYIDNVLVNCPECKVNKMKRVSEVIDCWFDSGAMPFAQWHYPFENKEIFKDNFPADFISEAQDQTRGWFYTLLAISTLLFDEPAYKNCIVLGLVQDKEGLKMSKHKGNVIDPWTVFDHQGADAARWYFYTGSAPWLPSRFYEDAVSEYQRKFMGTLWNTYAFYTLYADIDCFNPDDYKLEHDKLDAIDKWILSKLHSLIKLVDTNLENYRITESARAVQGFVDDLSNWYIRRNRERFWQPEMPQDKINAYMTLYTVLRDICRISAPFVPFISETIYQNIVSGVEKGMPQSVHLCDFPVYDESIIDTDLEKNMKSVLDIVAIARNCRNTANIKNRQPIGKMMINSNYILPKEYNDLILDELNIKELCYIDNADKYMTYKFKPQLKTVGPKYGRLLPKITKALADVDGSKAMSELTDKGELYFAFDDVLSARLLPEDLLIEKIQKEGYVAEGNNGITVIIETNLSDELIEEGFVREIISKIQNMRKEAGFEVTDTISFRVYDNDYIIETVKKNAELISDEVLADKVYYEKGNGFKKEWDINGEKALFEVEKEK
jgi:isoleucyl-tRNA synthetase